MSHNLTALILKGNYQDEMLDVFDLRPIRLTEELTLFHINKAYTACWQAILKEEGMLDIEAMDLFYLPKEHCIKTIVDKISLEDDNLYAIIQTDYFGGVGSQCACVFKGDKNLDKSIESINQALCILGVKRNLPLDEFDTVGLSQYRSEPTYLEKYSVLAEILGV